MVHITKELNNVLIEIKGVHKIWAFKNQLQIPVNHVIQAYQDVMEVLGMKRVKALGTSIPFLIHAGTFYEMEGTVFMDVVNPENAVIILLKNEEYKKLIVEVEDPEETIKMLAP